MAIEALSGQPTDQLLHDETAQDVLFTMLEHVPVGIAILDGRELRIQFANRHLHGILDKYPGCERMAGARLRDVIPGAEERGLQRWVMQVRQSGRADTLMAVCLTGVVGRAISWDITIVPLKGRIGGVPAIMLQIVDVTDTMLMR